ncbi:hypothetical protein JOF33_001905 [Corynebacterium freneyi]|uniref:Uncharacterized protein n=1 Tax=Corynebacterium freneyi TaxID=134034 RepID=A0ABS4U9J0_9CORY|nr:hypothetical protein [Corynebacterium freneyi]
MSASGEMRGDESRFVPVAALGFLSDDAGDDAGEQRDAQEHDDGDDDGPEGEFGAGGFQAEPRRQDLQVEPAEHAEHEHLEDGVDGHEHGGGFAVAAGQVAPHEDHGDAAGEADDDQPGAQGGLVGEENPGQGEHEGGANHPVEQQRDGHEPFVGGDFAGLVVADLRQRRVHHHQQAEGDGR